ncbi:MAG: ribosome-binding factor [Thermosediminibacterales bacterium]|nr:ribosome-binding factor [Thermosediminibacterales bacterium]MDK2901591.1 ribosome-binding factor [Thermosediminibacterales bacterium]
MNGGEFMAYHRTQRVAEEMKKEISNIIINEIKDPRISGLITITSVDISDDLRHAKVFVSIYGEKEKKMKTIEGLKNATGFIRREVGNRIRLRYTPEIVFKLDESIEHGVNIAKLLKEVGTQDDKGEK